MELIFNKIRQIKTLWMVFLKNRRLLPYLTIQLISIIKLPWIVYILSRPSYFTIESISVLNGDCKVNILFMF